MLYFSIASKDPSVSLTLLAFSTVSQCRNLKFFSWHSWKIEYTADRAVYFSSGVFLCSHSLCGALSSSMATRGQAELSAQLGVRCIIMKLQNVMLPVGMLDGTYGIFKTF